MAGSGGRYVKSKNSNPFFDDDDEVDDDTFLKNARSPVKSPSSNSTGFSSLGGKLSGRNSFQHLDDDGESFASARKEPLTQEERLEQMLKEKQRIEERTLQASRRARGVLDETEKIGINTAEELLHQREQLERTGSRLDEMNNSLRTSEKHINGIKSIFSGFKNYFSKPAAAAAAATGTGADVKPTSSNSDNALARTLEQQQQQQGEGGGGSKTEHPALRIRGLENDFSHKPLSNVDEQLEQDLGEMSQSLARLKGLAKGLGTEIDDQNQLIDRIQSSTDKADWRIQRQNKDMERLLKK